MAPNTEKPEDGEHCCACHTYRVPLTLRTALVAFAGCTLASCPHSRDRQKDAFIARCRRAGRWRGCRWHFSKLRPTLAAHLLT